MEPIKEITSKQYHSKHDSYVLAIQDGEEKKKYRFEKCALTLTNAKDIALVDAEYERRYLITDKDGEAALDGDGNKVYGGDIKFVPVDVFERRRLSSPVAVKGPSGKVYIVTEADLIEYVAWKESGKCEAALDGDERNPQLEAEMEEFKAWKEAGKGKFDPTANKTPVIITDSIDPIQEPVKQIQEPVKQVQTIKGVKAPVKSGK